MITLRQLCIGVGVLICLSYGISSLRAPRPKPAPIARPVAVTLTERTEERVVEKTLVAERLVKLDAAKEKLDRRQTAADQLPDYRQQLLNARRTEWSALIQRHWDEYKRLHNAAGLNTAGETPCTICDDSFLKFCLLCDSKNNGKCPECHGKGLLLNNDICPACSATGKCFMCAGTGKMPCPFCDQRGMIYHASPPPSFVPIPL